MHSQWTVFCTVNSSLSGYEFASEAVIFGTLVIRILGVFDAFNGAQRFELGKFTVHVFAALGFLLSTHTEGKELNVFILQTNNILEAGLRYQLLTAT